MNGNLPPPAKSTSGPQTRDTGTQIWRVFVILLPNRHLQIVINNIHPGDPPLNHYADFQSIDEMRAGTSFHATRHNINIHLHRIQLFVYPDGTDFDVVVENPHGLALWIVV
ncbi:hypothetical protein FVEG_04449 [Fusarium verticillioides 7600]|uniref:Uncharacterized protein n=1 Tax=Gibberella moniliformis (strain M3125 / FGSC 7600) TaxID=334819 RepID=W7LTZ9_GIBM7|nr:hypothetical protein FVEG_04449 [Fusarium verticillioides 7600]EWG42698.1 hypothetical protein FVEG_04449 [Fusarium verticillioides 7600]